MIKANHHKFLIDNMENIEIVLVSNAGMLLKYKNIKVLIDGIYIDETGYFSQVPDEVVKQYEAGTGDFGDIDYILFTHDHEDHFSMRALQNYLATNNPEAVFLPHMKNVYKEKLKEKYKDREINFIDNYKTQKHTRYIINDEMKIDVYPATHSGEKFASICNLCYLITINNEKILFTGDVDMKESNFWYVPELGKINTLVVNTVFLQNTEGRRIINEYIDPDKVLVCHIPFEEDDKFSWRKYITTTKKKYKDYLPQITLLMDKKQKVLLPKKYNIYKK